MNEIGDQLAPEREFNSLEKLICYTHNEHFRVEQRKICENKIKFRSAAEARQFNQSHGHNRYVRLYPYKCPVCGYFHLTKNKHVGEKGIH